ncbi:hypothetical protein GCM10011507_23040 [Edaphobacter acidisoli]|uniref:Uncharacterized protein n=1 Tax=Edaphobacter acidisoli TaxID=2040573 RepID=A0A916W6S7_9BACT|nr:hypothetical protein GCM10011507_23040 [Edaphobacter acidisoli]
MPRRSYRIGGADVPLASGVLPFESFWCFFECVLLVSFGEVALLSGEVDGDVALGLDWSVPGGVVGVVGGVESAGGTCFGEGASLDGFEGFWGGVVVC